jgi:ABC-type glycerol-3-phosphate transport system substrate-binding protein
MNLSGDEDYKTAITVAIASGDPPDIFYAYGGNWLKFFVDEGLLADLTPYWEQYKWKDRLDEKSLKGAIYSGKYYAVPTELTSAGIYYNKRIFEELGIEPPEVPTWDEFLGYCEKIQAAGYLPLCLGDKEGSQMQWWWDYSVVRENGNEYRKKVVRGEIPLNDKGVLAGLGRIMTDIFNAGYMNDNIVGLGWFDWFSLMAAGDVGMTLVHSFIPPQFFVALMEEPFEIGYFLYPQVHKDIEIANDLYVEGFQALSAIGEHNDEGAKWLDYMISPEVQTEWAAISFIPVVKGTEKALPPLTKYVYELGSKYDTFAHLDLEFHPEVKTSLLSNLQSMVSGELTPQEAMDAAQAVAETAPWVGVPQGEAG